jgi:hypothetical protein
MFDRFQTLHGPAAQIQPVSSEAVERYRGRLPDDLLELWREVGWGAFAGGFLWLVDPEQLADPLEEWLGHREALAFMRTAFGNTLIWYQGQVHYLDVLYARLLPPLTDQIDLFFNYSLCRERYLDKSLDRPTYLKALPRLGVPTRDEVYAYVPALALGGSGDAASLQKVNLREHLSFLAQLRI